MMRRSWWGIVAALIAGTACTNAGQSFQVAALTTGGVHVAVFFDRDGSASLTAGDTVFAGVRVALLVPGGPDTLRTAVTNALGIATFDSLPVGSYRVVIDRHALSDSVGVVAGDTGTIRIINESDSLYLGRVIRLGYAEVTLAGARALPAGLRVLVRAKVSSPLQLFRDSSAFLFDTSGALRVTGSRAQLGSGGNSIGDSVVVIGTTGQRSGQGVLQGGLFGFIAAGIAPLPRISTITEAHTANGGTLDAALIQLSNVIITDTLTSGPDFMLKVADPADTTVKTSILLDQLLGAPHGLFVPGRTGTFRGVLVPVGDSTWVMKPRNGSDVVLN
jgi:hypothetical protein